MTKSLEIKKCIPIGLKKMNDLGIKLPGKDLGSQYGKNIRNRTICQHDLEEDDEENEHRGDDDDCFHERKKQ